MATNEDYLQSILSELKRVQDRLPNLTPERLEMVNEALRDVDQELDGLLDALDELDEQ